MNAASMGQGTRADSNVRFAWLVEEEREHLTWKKAVFDWDYPDHAKSISFDELKEIARLKVMERLCMPPDTTEEGGVREQEQEFGWFGFQFA